MFSIKSIALVVLAFPFWAQAKIQFSQVEKDNHRHNLPRILSVASGCLERTWNDHNAFYDKWRVSRYYGDRNPSLDTREERRAALAAAGAPVSLVDELIPTSCIGLTMQCLSEGFESTADSTTIQTWGKINAYVRANDMGGTFLQEALQALGWKLVYWNPNPSKNTEWDQADPARLQGKPVSWNSGVKNDEGQYIYHPGWGLHEMRYQDVLRRGKYYTLAIDDASLLVNFKTNLPRAFTASPFFVGIAHAGYHVFPGFYGKIIEAHSMRRLDARDNLEESAFNPLAPGGGPRDTNVEKYRSGVLALPPVF